MNRKMFLKLAGSLGAAAALGVSLARKAEAMDDALTRGTLSDLKDFTDWLGTSKGYIGEVNWANDLQRNRGDTDAWNALGEAWFQKADAAGLWVTGWGIDEWQRWGGFYLSIYTGERNVRTISLPQSQAPGFEAHKTFTGAWRGINLGGAEPTRNTGFSNTNPGVYDTDYWYPSAASINYLASRGHRLFRLPFRWERMQPTLGGPLDPTEVAHCKDAMAAILAAGGRSILDCHNYGKYITAAGPQSLNSSSLPSSYLVDFWKKMAVEFSGANGCIGFDLMNEPYNQGGIAADAGKTAAQTWERIMQDAVTGIRSTGQNRRLIIPVYAGMGGIRQAHPAKWITDPKNNFVYTAHQYFDQDRYGRLPDGKNGHPAITDPDTGQTYAKEPGTGGGHYAHSYDSDNLLASYRGF